MKALNTVADSLPGLGIVAAVLGVVITMGALGGPPEEIGHKVAAALVGTFLGILLCYGLLGPMASKMGKAAEEEHHFYHAVRVALSSFLREVLRRWRWSSRGAPCPGTYGRVSPNWKRPTRESRLPVGRRQNHSRSSLRKKGAMASITAGLGK